VPLAELAEKNAQIPQCRLFNLTSYATVNRCSKRWILKHLEHLLIIFKNS